MRSASSWREICSSRPAGMRETVDGVTAVMSARSICTVEPGPVIRVTPRASSRRKMPRRSSPSRVVTETGS